MTEKELFKKIDSIAKSSGYKIYVVGGYVRDQIIGRSGKDIDFVVVGDAMKFASRLKKELKILILMRF